MIDQNHRLTEARQFSEEKETSKKQKKINNKNEFDLEIREIKEFINRLDNVKPERVSHTQVKTNFLHFNL